jgi:hypothetical protein
MTLGGHQARCLSEWVEAERTVRTYGSSALEAPPAPVVVATGSNLRVTKQDAPGRTCDWCSKMQQSVFGVRSIDQYRNLGMKICSTCVVELFNAATQVDIP